MKTPSHDVQVLIVDDNPLVRDLMCHGMEPHCKVISAADGADALLKSIDNPPDLIICDFRMPGLDGRQLYEKLRGRENTRNIPFVFVASRETSKKNSGPRWAVASRISFQNHFSYRTWCGRPRKSSTASIWRKCRSTHRGLESFKGVLRK